MSMPFVDTGMCIYTFDKMRKSNRGELDNLGGTVLLKDCFKQARKIKCIGIDNKSCTLVVRNRLFSSFPTSLF